MERLVAFRYLGLHEQLHGHGNLSKRAGEKAEKATDLAHAAAHGLPRRVRLAEPEFPHQLRLQLEPIAAERGTRSDSSAEFADQNARSQLREPLTVSLHGGKQCRRLESECERYGLLEIAAAGHRSVAVTAGRGARAAPRSRRVFFFPLWHWAASPRSTAVRGVA